MPLRNIFQRVRIVRQGDDARVHLNPPPPLPPPPQPHPIRFPTEFEYRLAQHADRVVVHWTHPPFNSVGATERARELLVAQLDRRQRHDLAKRQRFAVTGGSTGRVYEVVLDDGRDYNVRTPDARYCIHDQAGLPMYDLALVQKLMIEQDEGEFLRIANRSPAFDF